MVAEYTLYIASGIITGSISLVLSGIAFRHRDQVAAKALAWLMMGITGWCLFPGLGLLTKSDESAYLIARTAYLFFTTVPVLWIRFTYQYVKRQLPRVVWIDREITEQVKLYQKVEHLANTDSLTGLANRRHFFNLAQEFLDRSSPEQTSCAFILIDIDHFKDVNDKFGHLVGDELLHLVSSRLVQQLRAWDLVARYGGEEFIIFLPDTSQAEAEQVAQRLCHAISIEPFALGEMLVPLSISIGMVSALMGIDLQIDQLIEKADDALYAAKRAGRNTMKVYPVRVEYNGYR